MSRRFCSWTNPGQYKTRKKINFVYKKISIIFVYHLNQKKKL